MTGISDGGDHLTQQIDSDPHTSSFAIDTLRNEMLSIFGVGTPQATSTYDYYDGDAELPLSADAAALITWNVYHAEGEQVLMNAA